MNESRIKPSYCGTVLCGSASTYASAECVTPILAMQYVWL